MILFASNRLIFVERMSAIFIFQRLILLAYSLLVFLLMVRSLFFCEGFRMRLISNRLFGFSLETKCFKLGFLAGAFSCDRKRPLTVVCGCSLFAIFWAGFALWSISSDFCWTENLLMAKIEGFTFWKVQSYHFLSEWDAEFNCLFWSWSIFFLFIGRWLGS